MFGLGLVPSVSVGSSANMAIVKVFDFWFFTRQHTCHVTFTFLYISTKSQWKIPPFRNPFKALFFHLLFLFLHSLTCQSTPASSTDTLPELRAVPVGLAESYGVAARLTGGSGLPAEDAAALISSSPANSRACGLEYNSFQPCVVS